MTTYQSAQTRAHSAFLCRTPIDPPTKILCPGLMRGNTDLQPATCGERALADPVIGGVR